MVDSKEYLPLFEQFEKNLNLELIVNGCSSDATNRNRLKKR